MGLVAWLQSLRGKARDSASPVSTSYPRHHDTRSSTQWSSKTERRTPTPTQAQYDAGMESKKARRRSRATSLSRPKSLHSSKNRRSWFGGKPDENEDIPVMPRLVSMGDQQHQQDAGRREVGVTALSMPSDTRNPRPIINRAYSRKEDESTAGERELRRRPSWFNNRTTVEALPPLPPAVPISLPTASKPSTSTLPADKRRSRAASVKSVNSTRSRKKRSSFWASSNPDDESDSDVPPVPALVRGASTESSCNESSDASDDRHRTIRKSITGEDLKQRPLSTASRKYVPKSAAKGFLKSTNGASDEARKSFRQSFHLEDQADMVCLTEEQRVEWAKLMERENKLEDPFESAEDDGNQKFSNSQALAALEFGIR
ncbi:hypothetical protein AC579_3750 [Pseudocercospora musae]|uniref:Uncharacterized protein n=1 Tax=Pseudocercospora musae TaxID=113226 RepID=A0A139INT7_9PEZI|nr:hypothetical protein AC579_3750 [Pseudocercospora musae]